MGINKFNSKFDSYDEYGYYIMFPSPLGDYLI